MGRRRGGAAQQQKGKEKSGGPIQFTRDVRKELRKVSWPNREQLRQSTMVVLIVVITLGLYVAAWDFVFERVARVIFL